MEGTDNKEKGKKKGNEVKIFSVPFDIEPIQENNTLLTFSFTKLKKEQLFNQAIEFHSEGNISEARKYYQYFLDQGFSDPIVFSNYGLILRDMGKLNEAEKLLCKAVELKPDFADAYVNLGCILKDNGKLKEAEASFHKAIILKPNFADAYSNLGSVFKDMGKLKEAEISLIRAYELESENKNVSNNLISLLTLYKPKNSHSYPFYLINEEFRRINLAIKKNNLITDNEAIQIYKNGYEIYKKYNLNIENNLSQIYKRNEINLNCDRHMLIFNQHKIIPEFCFSCYKVQVEVDSVIELIKLFLVFNKLNLKNKNTRKCMIELRNNISGFYKGLIYCLSLNDALAISEKVNIEIQSNIRNDLISKIKRGCSEFPLEFPLYKEIRKSGDQPMKYDQNWKRIEEEVDKQKRDWTTSKKTVEGFNLNDFLIMRNWIAYAIKIGDESVIQVTKEQIKGPIEFNYLNRKFSPKRI